MDPFLEGLYHKAVDRYNDELYVEQPHTCFVSRLVYGLSLMTIKELVRENNTP